MKNQEYIFEVGQNIALKEDLGLSDSAETGKVFQNSQNWAKTGKVFQISQRFSPHEQMEYPNRYRIQGLWFSEDEIFAVTKEENPEYFL